MRTDDFQLPEFEHVMTPMAHQTECFELSKQRSYFALLMEQGTAKTKVVLDTAQRLFLTQQIDGLLVVAPKGAYMNWIDSEIPAHLPKWLPTRIGYWNSDCTVAHEKAMWRMCEAKDNVLDIMCVNIEALVTDRGRGFAYRFADRHYTMMVVDESQIIKSWSAIRTKQAIEIGKICDFRRIMSGTPMPKNPLDLYAQFQFLSPMVFNKFGSWTAFKAYFAKIQINKVNNKRWEQILGFQNLEEMREMIKPHSYRKLKKECMDLPEKIFETRYIEHTKEQAKAYKQMKEEALIELSATSIVSSTSVLATMTKLHQINCGFVKDDDGVIHKLPSNRLDELLSLAEDLEGKVLIWAAFKQDVIDIVNALRKEYGNESTVHYYGDTSDDDRRRAITELRSNPRCRFFVATPAAAGRSLTLVEATWVIYYSYNDNLEYWLQSQDRNHRPGQKNNVTYFVLAVRKTVDIRIMKGLQRKEDLSAFMLDNWHKLIDTDEESLTWTEPEDRKFLDSAPSRSSSILLG